MPSSLRILAVAGLCALLGACSLFKFPGVHRIEVQQGNIITQEMVDQLKPGMTRRQVRFVLGTPLLEDTFNPNRWDYINRIRNPDGEETQKRFTVYFNGDILIATSGDWQPEGWPR
ncbi:outer membrane protein assembly factor BamE [Microbulbifer thermotolerans]|uniref:outer membrane protein assembly factor BamE n=1 Tax=Microbulbifer thermotolerans TaxID=252514 RepID=UPI0022499F7A|nr:outer membrane protein assembly factor BamE [Microbulbifer thermotolerans]MCX2779561.1 outer membrane protein assembly factor BamE [Microbulbifer thermotolerans]MCX2805629.1 outer membrane protein assembly factor BamE [Microbulbifer thermotolerans]MCX2830529.1 outer membrane protein assembly factor BamE [Microbulbifer thermotolerans]